MGLFKRGRKAHGRGRSSYVIDDVGVTRVMPGGKREHVRWDDFRQVTIITNDQGPWREDVMWLLEGDEGGCVVGGDAEGASSLLPRLQALPGFNNEAVIKAMSSADNARFLCWKRPDAV